MTPQCLVMMLEALRGSGKCLTFAAAMPCRTMPACAKVSKALLATVSGYDVAGALLPWNVPDICGCDAMQDNAGLRARLAELLQAPGAEGGAAPQRPRSAMEISRPLGMRIAEAPACSLLLSPKAELLPPSF